MTREQVMEALLAKWPRQRTGVVGFRTITRRWVSWMDDPGQVRPLLPLLVQYEMTENTDYKGSRGIPPTRVWDVRLLIYGVIPDNPTSGPKGVPDSTTPGASVLNPLIDAVETALAPPASPEYSQDADGCQTLGGIVYDCRVEGTTTKALGDHEPSGICGAIIPIRILVP